MMNKAIYVVYNEIGNRIGAYSSRKMAIKLIKKKSPKAQQLDEFQYVDGDRFYKIEVEIL